jgi:hypothetical protein
MIRVHGIDTARDFFVVPETVGAYIGLRDKTGREIYEDDVVIYNSDNPENPFDPFIDLFQVVFKNGCFKFGEEYADMLMDDPRGYEVIGNVHDSSEYLQVEDSNSGLKGIKHYPELAYILRASVKIDPELNAHRNEIECELQQRLETFMSEINSKYGTKEKR